MYVTHSPFLINRNAGHRVRVVDKGAREQGTRHVKNVTQTHYEPLRTSLGPSVAETAFIGGENLFVEGISDQVMLTAMNARLIRKQTPPSQRLDLNQVTIVPGGSHVAYMLYLARGRDPYKPACAVLLDSDGAGLEAQKAIKRGGAKGRPTVTDDLIVMLGPWASEAGAVPADGVVIEEPEDLVPLNLAGLAARQYARTFLGYSESEAAELTDDAVAARLSGDNHTMWNAVEAAFLDAFKTKPGKLGFAKELVTYLDKHEGDEEQPEGVAALEANYAKLLNTLAGTLRRARAKEDDNQREVRVRRIIDDFIDVHTEAATRDSANMMLDLIEAAIDNSNAGDVIRAGVESLRRNYDLGIDPLKPVENLDEFVATLNLLPRRAQMTGDGHLDAVAAAATSAGLPSTGSPEPDQVPQAGSRTTSPDAAPHEAETPGVGSGAAGNAVLDSAAGAAPPADSIDVLASANSETARLIEAVQAAVPTPEGTPGQAPSA